MDTVLDVVTPIVTRMWKVLLFIVMSLLFLPALFIVTNLQKIWTKQFDEFFS
ncbi:hypothetical protein IT401_02295 [Candidatus Nomurabacteria bacterium]|nr:hypothetical protein [Candidatus Nomurabacteria bacterium]